MTQLEQPFHILRKDAKHLWPELTLHTILLIAFAWIVPLGWAPHEPTAPLFQVLPVFLHLLLPILWLVLISRLVHDESLVGDQQFWLTRPYTWPALLASKALFLVTFIFIPFLAMQCYLLFHAGLHPIAALPSLLLNLLYVVLLCFLPFTVLAAVTSTFPRLALSIISALIYLIVLALLIAYFSFSDGHIPHTPPPQAVPLLITVYAVFSLVVLLFQYAKRRSLYARIALVTLPLLVALLLLALPTDTLFRQAFPPDTATGAAQIRFNAASIDQPQTGRLANANGNLSLVLPVILAGQSRDTMLEGNAVTFTLDSTSGNAVHYVGPWQSGGLSNNVVLLALPEEILKRLGGQPARLHITLAAQRFVRSAAQTVTFAEHFTAPGGGVCLMANDAGNAICRYAVRNPPMTQYVGGYSTVPCDETTAMPASRPVGMGSFNAGPQLVFLDPVDQASLAVSNPNPTTSSSTFLCPGTQLSFTQFHADAKLRFDLDVPSIQLDHYLARMHEVATPMPSQE